MSIFYPTSEIKNLFSATFPNKVLFHLSSPAHYSITLSICVMVIFSCHFPLPLRWVFLICFVKWLFHSSSIHWLVINLQPIFQIKCLQQMEPGSEIPPAARKDHFCSLVAAGNITSAWPSASSGTVWNVLGHFCNSWHQCKKYSGCPSE